MSNNDQKLYYNGEEGDNGDGVVPPLDQPDAEEPPCAEVPIPPRAQAQTTRSGRVTRRPGRFDEYVMATVTRKDPWSLVQGYWCKENQILFVFPD